MFQRNDLLCLMLPARGQRTDFSRVLWSAAVIVGLLVWTLRGIEAYDDNEVLDSWDSGEQFGPDPGSSETLLLCPNTCECPEPEPDCQEGIPVIRDGCGCCLICARQQGDSCDHSQLCDVQRQLRCVRHTMGITGICKVKEGTGCHIGGHDFRDGETFKLDCRTQCTCQNGTYGCVSMCPQEKIRPSNRCRNPQLVPVRGACCKEWMCEPEVGMGSGSPGCRYFTTEWSACSVSCGIGISIRHTNTPDCQLRNETRLCQIRPCELIEDNAYAVYHRIRRHKQCRATVRSTFPTRFRHQGCTSLRLYHPKFCGRCGLRDCCVPRLTTTLKIAFQCPGGDDSVPPIVSSDFMWIVKCDCPDDCRDPERSIYHDD